MMHFYIKVFFPYDLMKCLVIFKLGLAKKVKHLLVLLFNEPEQFIKNLVKVKQINCPPTSFPSAPCLTSEKVNENILFCRQHTMSKCCKR